jgi:hypothetical protein
MPVKKSDREGSMEVRWTVHIPQAMQQHGGGPRPRQNAPVTTTPALESKAGDSAPRLPTDEAK